jgi:hypothetical protein
MVRVVRRRTNLGKGGAQIGERGAQLVRKPAGAP